MSPKITAQGCSSQKSSAASALAFFEFELADFIRNSALAIFLPAGLILRTFFATRKLGAAAMALAISAYVIFPLLFLYTFTVSGTNAGAQQAITAADSFNEKFSFIPSLELDGTSAVRGTIQQMSKGDFASQVQPLFLLSARALSLANSDMFLFPLISLLISAVCALELYRLLSAPIFLPYFEAI